MEIQKVENKNKNIHLQEITCIPEVVALTELHQIGCCVNEIVLGSRRREKYR